jgi:hypothetical protein
MPALWSGCGYLREADHIVTAPAEKPKRRNHLGDAVRDAGNVRDGVLLFCVRRWWQYARVKRDGKRWIVKSGAEWAKESGLSVDQVHRALAALEENVLIQKARHKWFERESGEFRVLAWVRPLGFGEGGDDGA